MKLIPKILIVFMCSTVLFSCSSDKSSEISGNPNPSPISDGERTIHNFLNIEEETDYNNLIVEPIESTYKTSDDKIVCSITNNNPGKGFYYYEVPFIEKNIDGEWVRFFDKSNRLDVAKWLFCGIEGNTNKPNSCNIVANFCDYEPKIDEGNYRIVVFTAEKTIYADFCVVK